MQIADNAVVAIDYTLRNEEGDVLDSSEGSQPLAYLHGAANIIPGLEQALAGKRAGDELEVSVEPEDAYGEYSLEMVATLSRNMFEGVDELQVGMQFHASAPDGGMQVVTIRDIEGDQVTVDGNHPLAGQRLNFKVKVIDVRAATKEELSTDMPMAKAGISTIADQSNSKASCTPCKRLFVSARLGVVDRGCSRWCRRNRQATAGATSVANNA